MDDKTKAVETKVQDAATEQGEVDFVALLAAKDAELDKARAERENYKRGMLKAKGKIDDVGTDDKESVEDIIDRKVEERFLASKEAKLVQEQQDIIKSAALKVKELTLALKNRGQVAAGSGASSGSDTSEKTVTTETYWSKDQLEALKKRGIDPAKAKTIAMQKGGTLPIKT